MIHADPFAFCLLGKMFMEGFRNSELELTGIVVQRIGLRYFNAVFHSSDEPFTLCILRVFNRSFGSFAAGQATGQIRERYDKSSFILVRNQFHSVRWTARSLLSWRWTGP